MCDQSQRRRAHAGSPPRGTIIIVGDELLDGSVRDENSQWLGAKLESHGVHVAEIRFVPDVESVIAKALLEHLAVPTCQAILIVGGLGPTPDDVTYRAVASALDVPVEVSETMLGWVKQWWPAWAQEREVDRQALFRMAELPKGARVVSTSDGSGPLAYLKVDADGSREISILMLPGVPRYVRHLMSRVIEPLGLLPGGKHPDATQELFHGIPEHRLSRLLSKVAHDFPYLRVGSYTDGGPRIRLSGPRHLVKLAAEDIQRRLYRQHT